MTGSFSRARDRADDLLADARALPVAALLLAFLVYAPHLSNGFAWDDFGDLVQNPSVNGAGPWIDVFTRDIWWALSDQVGTRVLYYRPGWVALSRVLWSAGGGSPVPFHLAAISLHLAAALLGARLLTRLGASRAAASTAGLLFLVHPLAGETVYWASAIGEAALLVAALGTLLALRAAREATTRSRRRWLQATAAGCALAALGVKETGVVVPALALLEALLAPRTEWRARLSAIWPAWVPLLPWAAARALLLGESGVTLSLEAPLAQVARVGEILAWDLRRLAFPFPLSPGHAFPREPDLAAGFVALGALAMGMALLLWRRPRIAAWTLFVLIPLAPPLAQGFLSRRTGMPVAERYLYLSLFPFVAGAVLAAREVASRISWPSGASSLTVATLLTLASAAAGLNGRHYAGEDAYFARILSIYPEHTVALAARGQAALAKGDAAAALRDFEASVRGEPGRALAHLNVAVARERLGDLPGATLAAREALARDANLGAAHRVLARLLRDTGQLAEAGPHYAAAARLSPEDAGARADFGTWLYLRGDVAAAAAEWEQGLQRAPGHCELLFNVAMARVAIGRQAEARDPARRFLERCREGFTPQRAQAAAWLRH